MRRKRPSDETLVALRTRLESLPERSADRLALVQNCADLHGVSTDTIYRALREQFRPRALHRRDRGIPRNLSRKEMEHLCEIVAALKLRTTNQKQRHLSTGRAIDLLIDPGVETPDGLIRIKPNALTRSTVNRYLRAWGMDDRHIRQPPPAVRFQAEHSNDCWQFDLSPSDLKQVPAPLWVEEGRGAPTLMLFSVVDDRSGVAYQEYRCVYGEDAASGLRFLFNVEVSSYSHAEGVGWQTRDGAFQRESRTAVSYGQGSTRDALPFPHASERGRGQPLAAALSGPVQ
jgi:hypothetical protein